MGPGGAKAPPPIGLAPPPMILVIVQYSLIAIAKILLLDGRFDSYAKMYFTYHAVHVASKAIIFSLQIRIGYGIMYCHTLVY